MEDRLRNLENFALIATELAVEIEEWQRRSEERQRQAEERQRQAEERQRLTDEWQRQSDEWQRQTDELFGVLELSQRRRDELLQRMAQAIAVMQAEIVRIDETHS